MDCKYKCTTLFQEIKFILLRTDTYAIIDWHIPKKSQSRADKTYDNSELSGALIVFHFTEYERFREWFLSQSASTPHQHFLAHAACWTSLLTA